ncbi:MAG: omega amino acid--pyruvate aminotransferase [Betaproteobacteria bacterium RIFCSPLOWO2_12_FULL_67_28]|nr:MAG: omega amino acid--pyruvate aminotransferase [Betaproteobacteria bacterium RIFCSPLOWO2_02_FULL_68_150]OGA72336.1 MAG: omega amino acid--pyruvate aminotransferase [Betaproteobacteria bacterium RIFCSPLOWO2_12_FULL_67_28]
MNDRASVAATLENSPFFMPFSMNRQFKKHPRLLARAEGMYYYTPEGRKILDGTAGLWCVNAGHCRKKIVDAVARGVATLDFAPPFQMGHPLAFEFAERIAPLLPKGITRMFFTNSGSESVDTALKLALAYHRVRGEGHRMRLIGREKGYHGVNFGGTAVGGIVGNRKIFGALVTGVDHIRHTHDLAKNAFSRGQPKHGAELAEDLERLCQLHDPSTIAAMIVEPVACSAGVFVPPLGYLQKLREICDRHGILLIFDEVINAWGRLGKPFAADYFGVIPDLITTAKGITNGTVPMGAVFMKEDLYQAFMTGPENSIEMPHGYTYSAHPVACAAGLGTMDVYEEEGLLTRVGELAQYWEDAAHSLRDCPNVIDIRNLGLIAAIELAPRAGAPGARGFEAHLKAFEQGAYIRTTGDILAFSPPLIIQKSEIDQLFGTAREVLKTVA